MLSHVFKAKVSQQQEERLPALPAEAGKKANSVLSSQETQKATTCVFINLEYAIG